LTIAFGTGFLRFFVDYGMFIYLPLLLAARCGASTTMIGWMIAVSAMGSIVTAISIGRIQHMHSTVRLLGLTFLGSAIGSTMVALDQPLWIVAIGLFAFGMANGMNSPLQKSLLTQLTPVNLRGGVVAVDRVVQQIAKSLAPALMGLLLLVAPLEAVFWSLAAASLLGWLWLVGTEIRQRGLATWGR
jgi:predicted MFS family arabinose efflux permease